MTKVLVTGAAGFVGAHVVVALLKQGYEVHCILRASTDTWRLRKLEVLQKITVHEVDLTNASEVAKVVQKVNPKYVFHLATRGAYPTQNDPQDLLTTNIVGTWNLLTALTKTDCKLCVQTGSSSEYGFSNKPMTESNVPKPSSFYAVTKASNTLLGTYLSSAGLLPVVTVRLFSVFGELEEPSRLLPTLLFALKTKNEMKLADLQTARDYIYIDDAVALLTDVKNLELHAGEVLNCGTGTQTTLGELVTVAQKVIRRKLSIAKEAYPARSWDASVWVADMSHTFSLVPWRPQHTVASGIKKMWLSLA